LIENPTLWAALLGALVGGISGFALGEVKDWLARRRQQTKPRHERFTQFLCEVETLNRGLDEANDARNDDSRLRGEFERNRLKAERLVGSGSYYTKHSGAS
jgi:hypothetical protein